MISFFSPTTLDTLSHVNSACTTSSHRNLSSRVKEKSNQNHEQQHDDEEKMSIFLIKSDFYDASSTPIECGRHNEKKRLNISNHHE